MRGKGVSSHRMTYPPGITPAHAGKRLAIFALVSRTGDHPRPCGEKSGTGRARRMSRGSPPPMRGKAESKSRPPPCRRITPAHAGKSQAPPRTLIATWDHPRPCGEKPPATSTDSTRTGSPPPMRGKADHSSLSDSRLRITPAHAGKSPPYDRSRLPLKDHPRPCGEKYIADAPLEIWQGSPPPMRGKECLSSRAFIVTRITPAHAGKSNSPPFTAICHRDHPRPCGEKHYKEY